MTVKILNDAQKYSIINHYTAKTYNQKELATFFKVSERTIHRVLEQAGLATPVARIKGEAYHTMQYLKELGLDLNALKRLMLLPVVSPETVQEYLNKCSHQQLMKHFYSSGLVKIKELEEDSTHA